MSAIPLSGHWKPEPKMPPEFVAEWERCKPFIEAALEYDAGHYSIDDVWKEVSEGRATFWPGKQSAIITQFWTFPNAKACNHWLAGGDLEELTEHMQPVIDQWARMHGCTEMIIAGRAGWVRALKKYGFEPVWTALRKPL